MAYYADKIDAAMSEPDVTVATALWRDVLGEGFRPGDLNRSGEAGLASSVPVASEQFIHQAPLNFTFDIQSDVQLRVRGRVTGLKVGQVTRRKGFRQYDLARKGNRVSKNRSITFTATTGLVGPYRLYWKVRNGGAEAASHNELRGEIRGGHGREWEFETTSYRGYHYVEVYAVVNGSRRGDRPAACHRCLSALGPVVSRRTGPWVERLLAVARGEAALASWPWWSSGKRSDHSARIPSLISPMANSSIDCVHDWSIGRGQSSS